MHSTDKQLLQLLIDEETSADLHTISEHVEACPQCQARLHTLSGAGRWTEEVVAQLRTANSTGSTSSSAELEQTEEHLRTIVEERGDDDSSEIEADPIRLDFLGPPAHPELLGRLGRYDIERVIGAGGMGIVLKGYDNELHRAVAIKVLAPHLSHSAAARRRFAREAQATAAVIHPNVIPIHNVESEGKVPYLVMRYINGQSLQARVDRQGPLEVIDCLRIAQQTAAGLAAAHAQGLIHRDVKPANILLDEGIERVVLSDFGLARTVDDASLTHTGIVTGTPHYMSPEQAGGDSIDCRSDLFSLGCVIWFMLTGRPPFRAATAMGVLNRICHDTHHDIRQINHCVPLPLAQIIDRLLAKHADERAPSAHAVEGELLELTCAMQAGALSAEPTRWGMPAATSRARRLVTLVTAASFCMLSVLLIGAGVVFYGPPFRPANSGPSSAQTLPTSSPSQQATRIEKPRSVEAVASTSSDAASGAYALPGLMHGDRWHLQADTLRQEIDAYAEQDLYALGWLEAVERNRLQTLNQLERDLDQLSREGDGGGLNQDGLRR